MRTPNTTPFPPCGGSPRRFWRWAWRGGRSDSIDSARMATRSQCAQIVSTQCLCVK